MVTFEELLYPEIFGFILEEGQEFFFVEVDGKETTDDLDSIGMLLLCGYELANTEIFTEVSFVFGMVSNEVVVEEFSRSNVSDLYGESEDSFNEDHFEFFEHYEGPFFELVSEVNLKFFFG
jgi:hypothetical protein